MKSISENGSLSAIGVNSTLFWGGGGGGGREDLVSLIGKPCH